ncbi:DUF3470 domain-containing protein [Cystobacter fuscus]|nr:DUF3470 domain-containing protein [Cystobacter fuscus]
MNRTTHRVEPGLAAWWPVITQVKPPPPDADNKLEQPQF